jgi:hypothetical protein
MQPIPTPELLDPDRRIINDADNFTVDHETRAHALDEALHHTCAYAQQLWHHLDAMRGYLLTSLPPDPHSPGPHPTASASPTGPDDDTGWDNWITAYAAVTSALCGPHGDSGYGLSEGRREATLRRSAPRVPNQTQHPDPSTTPASANLTKETDTAPSPRRASRSHTGHQAATVVLILLALRGLRPRPHRRKAP